MVDYCAILSRWTRRKGREIKHQKGRYSDQLLIADSHTITRAPLHHTACQTRRPIRTDHCLLFKKEPVPHNRVT